MDQFYADASRHTDALIADRRLAAEMARAQGIINQVAAERDAALAQVDEYLNANAGNMAVQTAAMRQLELVDPTNPLVTQPDLRKQIAAAGRQAMADKDHWDAVREAGRTFPIPGRP